MRTAELAALLLLSQLTLSAQLAFDVASIKENKAVGTGTKMRLMPGGGISAEHVLAWPLITIAYNLKPFQLVGAPGWTLDTYYDVNAKPADTATREQSFLMLQALLVDRFKLAFHRETREVDGFALVQAKPGVFGPNLRPSAVDCEKAFADTPRCRDGGITENTMTAVGTPLWSLLQVVIGQVSAPVSDETKLTGTFDFDLRWSNDVAPSDDLRPIYAALQEQLGLKLEKRRVSTEVFVVDRIERPTAD